MTDRRCGGAVLNMPRTGLTKPGAVDLCRVASMRWARVCVARFRYAAISAGGTGSSATTTQLTPVPLLDESRG